MYVLDACALIALIDKEEGWEKVNGIIEKAQDDRAKVYMSIINLLEVFYHCIHTLGEERACDLIISIEASPVRVLTTIDDPVFFEAARLKASYRISLADAIACATASHLSATLVTCDHSELEEVEKKVKTPFLWIRPAPQKT